MPRHVDKDEALAFLRPVLAICLDEDLDDFVAGVDRNEDRVVPEVDFMAAQVGPE